MKNTKYEKSNSIFRFVHFFFSSPPRRTLKNLFSTLENHVGDDETTRFRIVFESKIFPLYFGSVRDESRTIRIFSLQNHQISTRKCRRKLLVFLVFFGMEFSYIFLHHSGFSYSCCTLTLPSILK